MPNRSSRSSVRMHRVWACFLMETSAMWQASVGMDGHLCFHCLNLGNQHVSVPSANKMQPNLFWGNFSIRVLNAQSTSKAILQRKCTPRVALHIFCTMVILIGNIVLISYGEESLCKQPHMTSRLGIHFTKHSRQCDGAMLGFVYWVSWISVWIIVGTVALIACCGCCLLCLSSQWEQFWLRGVGGDRVWRWEDWVNKCGKGLWVWLFYIIDRVQRVKYAMHSSLQFSVWMRRVWACQLMSLLIETSDVTGLC